MSVLPPLRIKVRLFAMQRETAGMRELRLEVPLGSTVEDAWAAVVEVVPALAPGRSSLRFAVNGDYSAPDRPLADGDEIACIPPVSGGSGEAEADPRPDERRRILEIREAPFGRRPGRGARRPPGHGRGRRRGGVPGPDAGHAGHAGAGPGGRGRAPRRARRARASRTRPSSRWPSRCWRRSPTRSRSASASGAWRSSTGPARCRWATRRSWWWPWRRTGTPRSRPRATPSTRRRRGHRSGRRSASRTGRSGSATWRGPGPWRPGPRARH